MKVVMLTSSYPKYAGETTAPFIEEIAASLARRGHEIHVLAPFHREVRRQPIERGVRLHFFRYSPLRELNVWGYAESLRADVGLRARTLVALPLAVGAMLWSFRRLLAQARAQGRPFDLVHAHWLIPNGTPAALAAAAARLPLVVSMHGSDVYMAERYGWLTPLAGATLAAAGSLTACSGDLYTRALRLGAPPERSRVVHYGVDPEAFRADEAAGARARAELGLGPEVPLILGLGRLVYKKGFGYLIEALPGVLARHPEARLVLAGYGDLRGELERRAAALGLGERVLFPGGVNREALPGLFSAADVFVVPSVRDDHGNVDGLPNVLLEGMAMRRPLVASRVAGIPEAIEHGVHGLLVPERDPAALAQAIALLLEDRAYARRLGEAARARIERELNWENVALQFEQVYLQALGGALAGARGRM
jgi:glycosyltransferase involved in cell wall biosynthesis